MLYQGPSCDDLFSSNGQVVQFIMPTLQVRKKAQSGMKEPGLRSTPSRLQRQYRDACLAMASCCLSSRASCFTGGAGAIQDVQGCLHQPFMASQAENALREVGLFPFPFRSGVTSQYCPTNRLVTGGRIVRVLPACTASLQR